ncbi:MAG: phosphoribosylanthranilate isomerase [Steroidobacteraceae bacterium]
MNLLVKICGVTTAEAVEAAIAAGADAIGFVFHDPSPRNVAARSAERLARGLPRSVLRVAVTRHPRREDVERVLECFVPDAWQSEAEDLAALDLPACIARWPVFRRTSGDETLPHRLVFDAPTSGCGQRADWRAAAQLAQRSELVLGGGLDASNVREAISSVRPFGVDVSSGVECSPGVKDRERIRDFIAAARQGARGLLA